MPRTRRIALVGRPHVVVARGNNGGRVFFDDTDYDPAEVAGSLDLREVVKGDLATVVASFRAEGDTHRVQWQLRNVDGEWKISDIISMSKDWSLSRFQCE